MVKTHGFPVKIFPRKPIHWYGHTGWKGKLRWISLGCWPHQAEAKKSGFEPPVFCECSSKEKVSKWYPWKMQKKTKFKLKNYENKQVHTFPKLMCSSGLLSEKAAQHRDSSRATHGDAVGDAWRRGRRIACWIATRSSKIVSLHVASLQFNKAFNQWSFHRPIGPQK